MTNISLSNSLCSVSGITLLKEIMCQFGGYSRVSDGVSCSVPPIVLDRSFIMWPRAERNPCEPVCIFNRDLMVHTKLGGDGVLWLVYLELHFVAALVTCQSFRNS